MITVHGVPLSPFARKVYLALRYKELDFKIEMVPPGGASDDFVKISPLRKIPVLEHDGFTIPDSSIILRYLDQQFPEKPLYPSNPQLQAKACWLEEYGDTKLIENVGPIFFQRFFRVRFLNEQSDETIVKQKIEQDLPPILSYLESVLPDEGYAIGDHLTVADIGIISPLLNGRVGGYTPDAAAHPKVAGFFERALAMDFVKDQLAVEKEVFDL